MEAYSKGEEESYTGLNGGKPNTYCAIDTGKQPAPIISRLLQKSQRVRLLANSRTSSTTAIVAATKVVAWKIVS